MSDTLEALNLRGIEFYELINGERAQRGRKIEDLSTLGQTDYIVVQYGRDALFVQFGADARGYDVFGNAHPSNDRWYPTLGSLCTRVGWADSESE